MAQRFLTDIDVKGNISVTGDVTSSKIETTNLTLGDVAVHLPEGATGSVTVATSADVTAINQSLQTKQEAIAIAEGSGITKAEDGKTLGIDTTVIATAQSVATVSGVADAAKEAAEANAETLAEHAEAIAALEAGATSHYEVTPAEGQTDVQAIEAALPKAEYTGAPIAIKGDTAVVKKAIAGGKMSYTAYVFDGANWAAMDGNYSASNVYLSKSIKMNGFTSVGNISITAGSSNETALAAGKSIEQALAALFSKEEHPSAPIPTLSVSFKKDGATFNTHNVEHGTSFTLSYDSTFTDNKFTPNYSGQAVQPYVGCAVDGWSAKLMESSSAMKDGTTDLAAEDGSWTVKANAGEVYQMIVKAGYTASTNKGITSDGNESNVGVTAVAVTSNKALSKSSNKITAYRKAFFGSAATPFTAETIKSSDIRALSSSTEPLGTGTAKTLVANVTTGHKQVLFALPKGQSFTKINHTSSLDALVTTSFPKLCTIAVVDGSGVDTYEYDVYACEQSEEFGPGNVFTMTI